MHLHAYKIQLCQHIMPNDCHLRDEFTPEMLSRIDENTLHLDTVCFSDKTNFHLCGKVNKHNCHMRTIMKGTLEVNVWCGLIKDCVIDPFFHKFLTD
jgi:hypothetical protein